MSDAAGRFTLLGVPPGEYVLSTPTGSSPGARNRADPRTGFPQPLTVGSR